MYWLYASKILLCNDKKAKFISTPASEELRQEVSAFVGEYISQNHFSYIISLRKSLILLITELFLMVRDNYDVDRVLNLINTTLKNWPDIQSFIDANKLSDEIQGVFCDINTVEEFGCGKEMVKIELIIREIEKYAKSSNFSPKEQIENRILSMSVGNPLGWDPEALVYKKSREIDCDAALDSFSPYFFKYIQRLIAFEPYWDEWYQKVAGIFKLIQWGQFPVDPQLISILRQKTEFELPEKFGGDMAFYEVLPFYLLRSDFAIDYFSDELKEFLKKIEDWLKHALNLIQDNHYNSLLEGFAITQYNLKDPSEEHIQEEIESTLCYVGAFYIFGYLRIFGNKENPILNKSLNYLLSHQKTEGYWDGDTCSVSSNRELTAMAIHALALAKHFGWERPCRLACKWLLKEEEDGGTLANELFFEDIMVLDCFSMCEDSSTITFNSNSPKQGNINIELKKEPSGQIQNNYNFIFDIPETVNKPSNVQKKVYKPWIDSGDSCFLIKNDRRLFYQNGIKKDLRLKKGSKAEYLLEIFARGDKGFSTSELQNDEILDIPKKSGVYKAIREVNRTLNDKIKSLNFNISDKVAFFAVDENDGNYYCCIPILTIEKYNDLLSQESNRDDILSKYKQPNEEDEQTEDEDTDLN